MADDHTRAFRLFRHAAEWGHMDAQLYYGLMYESGMGTAEDKQKAFTWYQKAAEQSHPMAQYVCGYMCEKGEGTDEDKEKAFMWYTKAVEQRVPQALVRRGRMYDKGEGVCMDKKEAALCYATALAVGGDDVRKMLTEISKDSENEFLQCLRAAEQGDEIAQYNCGVMYYYGSGTEEDKEKALEWYEKAAEQR